MPRVFLLRATTAQVSDSPCTRAGRHHANVEWQGVRSVYRLDNPIQLRKHHGRPGRRIRVLDADSHGTLISTLRPARRPSGSADARGAASSQQLSSDGAGTGWEGCTWEEEEEFQLRHLREESSPQRSQEPPPPVRRVKVMQGADSDAVICLEEGYARSWLCPSKFGGPSLHIELALRYGDWRVRAELRYQSVACDTGLHRHTTKAA